MRLLHTKTLKLDEFFGTKTPAYAVLSHRWEEEEVLFQDLVVGKGREKKGWNKLEGSCAKALQDGWEYLWVDTCCIDKASSAELSESINSMFTWYRNAHVCYAYLSDVDGSNLKDKTDLHVALSESVWFTRGWTLQELLAPEWLIFLADNWSELGTKASLATEITSITGIIHLFNFEEASVAQKMSWAARRQTTRLEDQAYCMMGLFDVNMPLLYGEGPKAFIRLHLEILSKSDDESIFAWSNSKPNFPSGAGLLAETPRRFEDCGQIKRGDFDVNRPPHFMTNKGLQMQLLLQPRKLPDHMPPAKGNTYIAPLNCTIEGDDGKSYVVVLYLLEEGGSYSRHGDPDIDMTTEEWNALQIEGDGLKRTMVRVKQSGHNSFGMAPSFQNQPVYSVTFDIQAIQEFGYQLAEYIIWPEDITSWSFWRNNFPSTGQVSATITSPKLSILLRFQHEGSFNDFTIIAGYFSRRPWLVAIVSDPMPLRNRAGMYDEEKWWPKTKDDERVLQDRLEIHADSSSIIEASLHRAGVRYSYGAEKYWMKLYIKGHTQERDSLGVGADELSAEGESEIVLEKPYKFPKWLKLKLQLIPRFKKTK